jgi:hypothetical protein
MTGINLEYSTDHIWTMEDKPGFIGLRLDCGDAGTIYFTKDQAAQVVSCLSMHLVPESAVFKAEFRPQAV